MFQAREQWDAEMLCKILKFFKLLIKKTKLQKIPDFKIGLTISAYSQAISTSNTKYVMYQLDLRL